MEGWLHYTKKLKKNITIAPNAWSPTYCEEADHQRGYHLCHRTEPLKQHTWDRKQYGLPTATYSVLLKEGNIYDYMCIQIFWMVTSPYCQCEVFENNIWRDPFNIQNIHGGHPLIHILHVNRNISVWGRNDGECPCGFVSSSWLYKCCQLLVTLHTKLLSVLRENVPLAMSQSLWFQNDTI